MGETHETETLPPEMSPEKTRKVRRNGMWNIFEGVDNAVLEKLGLSEEVVHQLLTEADDTVSEHMAAHRSDDAAFEAGGCRCRRARILRSFSATVGEDVKAALQNRRRRNAVGNLFEVLTPAQKLLLVEHLQEQLERLHCLCGEEGTKKADPAASATLEENNSGSNNIILDLTDFTASSSSPSSSSSSAGQPGGASVPSTSSSKEEVACH